MSVTFNRLDIRGLSSRVARNILVESLKERKNDHPIWLIDDKEPIDCYAFLVQENYLFETFIMSGNEYRVFIGSCYN